jgi:hypothetical protein
MDRPQLSAAIIAELADLFTETLHRNAARLVDCDLDGMEQCVQEMARTVFGPVVEKVVMAVATALPSQPPDCPHCQGPMRLVDGARSRSLQGLVGDYGIVRPYFVCDGCHRGGALLDERLGIGAGVLSPGLMRVACRLGIDDSFEDAVDALAETLRIELKDEAVRRVTEGVGAVAEQEGQVAIARAQAGKEPLALAEMKAEAATLLVEVDGVMVHEVDGNWHEVKVGLVAPLGPKTREDEETERSILVQGKASYCAGLESAETFWYRMYVEACRRGLGSGQVQRVVLLGDGAEWIWRYGSTFLGVGPVKVVEVVDIYHAFEHLGTVASTVFGQGRKASKEWLGLRKDSLREHGPAPLLASLAALRPAAADAVEEVRKAVGYFTENAARMDYPTFIAMNLPIGSGAIESSCKTLIEEREKGAGMRWTKAGAQSVATLRALHRSGRWTEFWKTHPQRRRPQVFPRHPAKPLPTKSLRNYLKWPVSCMIMYSDHAQEVPHGQAETGS